MSMMKNLWRRAFPARTLDKALERVAIDLRDGTIPREQFDMSTWGCGTAACIGGHLVARGHMDLLDQAGVLVEYLSEDRHPLPHIEIAVPSSVKDKALRRLFLPYRDPLAPSDATRDEAADKQSEESDDHTPSDPGRVSHTGSGPARGPGRTRTH